MKINPDYIAKSGDYIDSTEWTWEEFEIWKGAVARVDTFSIVSFDSSKGSLIPTENYIFLRGGILLYNPLDFDSSCKRKLTVSDVIIKEETTPVYDYKKDPEAIGSCIVTESGYGVARNTLDLLPEGFRFGVKENKGHFTYFTEETRKYIDTLSRLTNNSPTYSRRYEDYQPITTGYAATDLEEYVDKLPEDVVTNPSHYKLLGDLEAIEVIASAMTQDQFYGYCLGNIMKYRLRAGNKNKLQQDIDKSDFYKELYDKYKHLCKIVGGLK